MSKTVAMRPSTTADEPRRDEGHSSASEHLPAPLGLPFAEVRRAVSRVAEGGAAASTPVAAWGHVEKVV